MKPGGGDPDKVIQEFRRRHSSRVRLVLLIKQRADDSAQTGQRILRHPPDAVVVDRRVSVDQQIAKSDDAAGVGYAGGQRRIELG